MIVASCKHCNKRMNLEYYHTFGIPIAITGTSRGVDYCSIECMMQDDRLICGHNFKKAIFEEYKQIQGILKYNIKQWRYKQFLRELSNSEN